jgi:PLP dependent protein
MRAASALNKSLPSERNTPLNVLLQVNTSGEEAKSGLPAPTSAESVSSSELLQLAQHIITSCPRLRLQGLMAIGSLTQSLASNERPNEDFETLKRTRDLLEETLRLDLTTEGKWGVDGKLVLSMGMSSDFEAALKVGSDIVRVGTGIFGTRPTL